MNLRPWTALLLVGLAFGAAVAQVALTFGCAAMPAVIQGVGAAIDVASRLADLARRVCKPGDDEATCAHRCAAALGPPPAASSSAEPAPSTAPSSSSSTSPTDASTPRRRPAVPVPIDMRPGPAPTVSSARVWL